MEEELPTSEAIRSALGQISASDPLAEAYNPAAASYSSQISQDSTSSFASSTPVTGPPRPASRQFSSESTTSNVVASFPNMQDEGGALPPVAPPDVISQGEVPPCPWRGPPSHPRRTSSSWSIGLLGETEALRGGGHQEKVGQDSRTWSGNCGV